MFIKIKRLMKKIGLLGSLILGITFLFSFVQEDIASVVKKVHHDNMKEIMLATMAKEKASSEEIRNYANMLILDHTTMGDELAKFAADQNIDLSGVRIEDSVLPLDSLQNLTPVQFDSWFKAKAIETHEATIGYFQSVIANMAIDNAEIKTWMESKLPGLKSHLSAAQGLSIAEMPTDTTNVIIRQ